MTHLTYPDILLTLIGRRRCNLIGLVSSKTWFPHWTASKQTAKYCWLVIFPIFKTLCAEDSVARCGCFLPKWLYWEVASKVAKRVLHNKKLLWPAWRPAVISPNLNLAPNNSPDKWWFTPLCWRYPLSIPAVFAAHCTCDILAWCAKLSHTNMKSRGNEMIVHPI